MAPLLVLSTCPNSIEAQSLAHKLLDKKLAACVQLNAVTSIYRWQGKTQKEPEVQLSIKTDRAHYEAIEQLIKAEHCYDLPEIVAINIDQGSAEYMQWLSESLA